MGLMSTVGAGHTQAVWTAYTHEFLFMYVQVKKCGALYKCTAFMFLQTDFREHYNIIYKCIFSLVD